MSPVPPPPLGKVIDPKATGRRASVSGQIFAPRPRVGVTRRLPVKAAIKPVVLAPKVGRIVVRVPPARVVMPIGRVVIGPKAIVPKGIVVRARRATVIAARVPMAGPAAALFDILHWLRALRPVRAAAVVVRVFALRRRPRPRSPRPNAPRRPAQESVVRPTRMIVVATPPTTARRSRAPRASPAAAKVG